LGASQYQGIGISRKRILEELVFSIKTTGEENLYQHILYQNHMATAENK